MEQRGRGQTGATGRGRGQGAWSREHGAEGMEQRAWGREHGAESMGQRAWGREHGERKREAGEGKKKMGESLPPFHGVHFYYLSINLHFNSTIMAEWAGILRVERSSIDFPEITS